MQIAMQMVKSADIDDSSQLEHGSQHTVLRLLEQRLGSIEQTATSDIVAVALICCKDKLIPCVPWRTA